MSRRPDFFIVGAPKCGTTAVASYLGEHPRAYVSAPKEPNYFARHLTVARRIRSAPEWHRSLRAYERLFAQAPPSARAVGEASTRYIRSWKALREIQTRAPDARIVVGLRHPVDLVYSWHGQKLYEGQEDESDFEVAWRLQPTRLRGERIPPGLGARDALFYAKVGAVGSQLRRVVSLFGEERVHVFFLEDLAQDPRGVYLRLLGFLGLEDDGRTEFPIENPARFMRRRKLAEALMWRPEAVLRLRQIVQTGLGVREFGFARWVDRFTTEQRPRPPLSAEFVRELEAFFEPEIQEVERLTGRNLAHWRRSSKRSQDGGR